ncbi:deoxyribose-phosphate aldolase [Corynebacterium flavescens]
MEYLNLLESTSEQVRAQAEGNSVVVSPIHVAAALSGKAHEVISVAGYPTGRHHSLIKASEARLAVYTGATEIWVAVDPQLEDSNELLSELVAVREACPEPVKLALIATNQAAVDAAELAGFQRIVLHHAKREKAEPTDSAAPAKPAQGVRSALPTVDFDFSG